MTYRIDVMDTVRKVQKWATTASNAIDSEDGRLVEQVDNQNIIKVRSNYLYLHGFRLLFKPIIQKLFNSRLKILKEVIIVSIFSLQVT